MGLTSDPRVGLVKWKNCIHTELHQLAIKGIMRLPTNKTLLVVLQLCLCQLYTENHLYEIKRNILSSLITHFQNGF